MAHIDYYFATISPSSYLAGTRLEEIASKHGAEIHYKPVDIMGLFSNTGGVPPKDRHPNRQKYRLQDMKRVAARSGLAINPQPAHFPVNGAPAAYAIIAAQAAGGGNLGQLVHAILRAVWAEEKNISEDTVIKAALEENGFDASLADSGLLSGAQTYEKNLEDAIADGVFGAPFYVVDDQGFWGQDRLDDLDFYLGQSG